MTGGEDAGWRAVVREPDEVGRSAGASASGSAAEAFHKAPVKSAVGRILGATTEEAVYRREAAGEISVARILEKLPHDRWYALHDVPMGGAGRAIDHLLIGTAGVFSLTTKNLGHSNVEISGRALWVNRGRTAYVPEAANQAWRIRTLLGEATGRRIFVQPVLVLICHEVAVEEEPHDVSVVRRRDLLRWLGSRPQKMSIAEAARIAELAVKSATWKEPPGPTGPPE